MGLRDFKSKKNFNDAKGSSNKQQLLNDLVEVLKFPDGKWVQLRFLGPLIAVGMHWVQTKRKDGSKTSFPTLCLAFDSETEERDATKHCPWCDHDNSEHEMVRSSVDYYTNAIVRNLQSEEPARKSKWTSEEKETGWKDLKSESWTPVRVVRLTTNLVNELKRLSTLNRHKDKKTGETKDFPISHSRYGLDIKIMYDSKEKTIAKKYTIQLREKLVPLTEEEQEYLLWSIEDRLILPKPDTAKREYSMWAERMGLTKKKAPKKKVDDDFDEDFDDEQEDDEEEEAPRKKKPAAKKPVKKPARKSRDEDEDDEDDDGDFDDEEDEDDEPPAKKKKPARKSRDDDEDEDDEDGDFDDEDDEDDDPPPRKKKPAAKKPVKKPTRKSRDDDEDDEDEDEEDEDDEPPSKKKKPAAKKRKPSDDDDEDDDDDFDEEEDEDDDPPPRKKKPAAKKAPAKKRKPSDDDDDEDF